jgi:hypothetical protein
MPHRLLEYWLIKTHGKDQVQLQIEIEDATSRRFQFTWGCDGYMLFSKPEQPAPEAPKLGAVRLDARAKP